MPCNICQDRKVIEKEDGTTRPCVCTIQEKLKECLGEFSDATLNRKLKYDKLHRNMYLKNMELSRFQDLAKTYLTHRILRTQDFETEFVNVMGSDITEAQFNNHDEYTFTMFKGIEILFLRLGKDYQHKSTKEWVQYIINLRAERKDLITWVYTYPNTTDDDLTTLYGDNILDILKNNFPVVR